MCRLFISVSSRYNVLMRYDRELRDGLIDTISIIARFFRIFVLGAFLIFVTARAVAVACRRGIIF